MSYLQRLSLVESPFAQTYNTTTWNGSTTPNTTTSSNWMTGSGNGYDFNGSGYVFGFIVPDGQSIGDIGLESATVPRYTRSIVVDTSTAAVRAMSDDMCIGYASDTKHYQISNYYPTWPNYHPDSRFNVIRMEL